MKLYQLVAISKPLEQAELSHSNDGSSNGV